MTEPARRWRRRPGLQVPAAGEPSTWRGIAQGAPTDFGVRSPMSAGQGVEPAGLAIAPVAAGVGPGSWSFGLLGLRLTRQRRRRALTDDSENSRGSSTLGGVGACR